MERKLKWDEIAGILLMAVSIGLLGVSVFLCFSGDIWYDELFTMGLADQSCGRLVSITARDVHPPLYYLIVKLFLTLTGTAGSGISVRVMAAKLVSVLPFFLCMLYAGTKVRKNFGWLTAGLFTFLVVTMPGLPDYTVEVRMYGYALFFILAGMLHAYELTKKTSYANWIFLTLYALAACYTHYFACVAACMIYLYLFISLLKKKREKKELALFWISGAVCAAGYLPWIITAVTRQVGQVKEAYWIQPLSWRTLGGCVKFLFQPFFSNKFLNLGFAVLLFMLYGILLAAAVWKLLWKKEKEVDKSCFALGCVGVLLGIVAFGFLASFLVRPIFVYRYMLPAMGVFWLAFAILIAGVRKKKEILLSVVVLLLVVGGRNYRAFYGEEMWKRLQMAEVEKALAQVKENDLLIFNFDQTQGVVSAYLDQESFLWYGSPEALIQEMDPKVHPLVEGEFSDEAGIARLKELLAKHGRLWFAGSGNAREEIIEKWERAGIQVQECSSVMIERYWFNLYRICIDERG